MPNGEGGAHSLPHPNRMFRYLALAAALAVAATVWLTLQMPASSVSFARTVENGMILVSTQDAYFLVDPDTSITFRAAGHPSIERPARRVASTTPDLAGGTEFKVAGWLAEGDVDVELRDTSGSLRALTMARVPRTLASLPASYWLDMIVGLAGILLGIGVWVLRPRDWRAIAYLTGAFGLSLAQVTHGAELLVDPATGRDAYLTLIMPNLVGLYLLAAATFFLFLDFPTQLVSRRIAYFLLALVSLLVVISIALTPVTGVAISLHLLMVLFLLILGLIAVQGWVGRHHVARRATLGIIVTAVLVGTAIYFPLNLLPQIFDFQSPVDPIVAVPILLLIYASIGLAIARSNLVTLSGWTRNAIISVSLVGLVLLLDIVLIGVLSQQDDIALGIAFAAVAIVYFPVREWFSHRADRRRQVRARRALRLATDLAFATQGADRIERWREAVSATFDPLDLSLDSEPGTRPRIAERGVALHLPPVAGAPALIARHANSGQRLFVAGDIESAAALIDVVARLVAARDAYVHGASEERQRIARDLHDDVSGRLMTSLHRSDADAMRHDVREAMADIRTIVNGLVAEPRALGELLADLRHESQARLDAFGVDLVWAASPELEDPRPLDYPVYRHLVSVLRESVSNIVRHSGASRVDISVRSEGATLSIEITDNGRGISIDVESGNGLRNCARRAEALGGSFEISPTAAGTVVRFQMSIPGSISPSGSAESTVIPEPSTRTLPAR